jgi:hypothetical protein
MGNKVDAPKVRQFITEISETTEISENFLKSEFKNLLDNINNIQTGKISGQIKPILEEILSDLNTEAILNFIQNLIEYLKYEISDIKNFKICLELLEIILNSIYLANQNLRDFLIFSINKCLNKYNSFDKARISENKLNCLKKCFPVNLIIFLVDLIIDEEFFEKKSLFQNEVEKFEVKLLLTKILYNTVYFQRVHNVQGKNYIDYLDICKTFFTSYIFSEFKFNKFLSQLFSNSIVQFLNYYRNKEKLDKNHFSFMRLNSVILFWFCVDINKFFFSDLAKSANALPKNSEFYFDNEFNEKVFQFSLKFLIQEEEVKNLETTSPQLNPSYSYFEFINQYNLQHKKHFKLIIQNYSTAIKDAINQFYINYDKIPHNLTELGKIFILYSFETNTVSNHSNI